MSTNPPPRPGPEPGAGSVASRLEEALDRIELELRHAVAYVNDEVVPQVRSESISAMRTVADRLRTLADRLDRRPRQPPPPPAQNPRDPRSS